MNVFKSKIAVVLAVSLCSLIFSVTAWSADKGGAATITKADSPGPVSLIKAWAVPGTYEGPCPKAIKFIGHIEISAPVTLNYYWKRSDGGRSQPVRLDLSNVTIGKEGNGISLNKKTGVSLVFPYPQTDWTLGDPGSKDSITETFVVDAGSQHLEATAPMVKMACDGGGEIPKLVEDASAGPVGGIWTVNGKGSSGVAWKGTLTLNKSVDGKYTGEFNWKSSGNSGIEKVKGSYDLIKNVFKLTGNVVSGNIESTTYSAKVSKDGKTLTNGKWEGTSDSPGKWSGKYQSEAGAAVQDDKGQKPAKAKKVFKCVVNGEVVEGKSRKQCSKEGGNWTEM